MQPTDRPQRRASPPPRLRGGFAVLGVRATGLSPVRARLVEVAVVLLDPAGARVRRWTTLVDPHGAGGAPVFAHVAGELAGLLGGRVLVAHDAAPVVALLRAEFTRCAVAVPAAAPLCTLEASWRYLPPTARRRLGDCCAAAGVPDGGDGTALAQARATADLLQWYLGCAGQRRDGAVTRLVQRAPSAAWPVVPGPRAAPMPRTAPATAPFVPAVTGAGRLAALLRSLRLDSPDLPLPAVAGYAEALARVLAEGPVTAERTQDLADVADACGLVPAQARAAHRGVLRALARAAGEGGRLSAAERAEVLAAAAALGVDADELDDVLGSPQRPGPPPGPIDLRGRGVGALAGALVRVSRSLGR